METKYNIKDYKVGMFVKSKTDSFELIKNKLYEIAEIIEQKGVNDKGFLIRIRENMEYFDPDYFCSPLKLKRETVQILYGSSKNTI